MRFINRGRQSGKTTMLIHSAYVTGTPIIVYDESRKHNIMEHAKRLNCDVEVLTVQEWVRFNRGGHADGAYIDEALPMIEQALSEMFNTNIKAITFTLPMDDLEGENKKV